MFEMCQNPGNVKRTIEALKILQGFPQISAGAFALEFWPNSKIHQKVSNTGNGACRGKAAWLCAGSFWGKLEKSGYIKRDLLNRKISLTEKGLELIRDQKEIKTA